MKIIDTRDIKFLTRNQEDTRRLTVQKNSRKRQNDKKVKKAVDDRC